jgi:hypothetical protein
MNEEQLPPPGTFIEQDKDGLKKLLSSWIEHSISYHMEVNYERMDFHTRLSTDYTVMTISLNLTIPRPNETDKSISIVNKDPFVNDLQDLINRHSIENESSTPDFILAEYMQSCLKAFEIASLSREKWYGQCLNIKA